jgi:hypothetical protein
MYYLLLGLVLLALYKVPKPQEDSLRKYKVEAHKYSGLNPELYAVFTNELRMFQSYVLPDFLYKALEALEELALYTRGGSSSARDDIRILVCNIGDEGEQLMLKKGVLFTPKYLKETPLIQ